MVRLDTASSASDLEHIRVLFREYADALGVNLDYQGFDEELRDLPGSYAPPAGTLLLARNEGDVVGCVGVRPIDERTAEMKRLYVRSSGRGLGLGRTLAEAAIRFATVTGYERMRLDTLPMMVRRKSAVPWASESGVSFRPVPGTVFLELVLTGLMKLHPMLRNPRQWLVLCRRSHFGITAGALGSVGTGTSYSDDVTGCLRRFGSDPDNQLRWRRLRRYAEPGLFSVAS
jgi:GNAT superfamily N-acetyltransferase